MKISAFILGAALVVPTTLAAQTTISSNHSPSADNDRLFLHSLAREDHSEIDLAKLALHQSHNPQVKQYAKTKILAADPSMEQQAKQIGDQNHMPIRTEVTGGERAEYKTLSKLSGDQFDRAYAQYESQRQRADLTAVENAATTALNSQVRSFALKEETPVRQAAQSAQQLAQAMKGR